MNLFILFSVFNYLFETTGSILLEFSVTSCVRQISTIDRMSTITCLACNVGFEDADLGRIHYKSDWHRYNLKRKVVGFPPVTLEEFEQRQSNQNKQQSSGHEFHSCKPCNKSFSTANAFENHMQSKKHKDMVTLSSRKSSKKNMPKDNRKSAGRQQILSKTQGKDKVEEGDEVLMSEDDDDDDGSDAESWDSYDENCLGLEECLFCSLVSSTMEDSLKHMTSMHGFFLPDAEYISDLEGLINYLGEKVGAGRVCLWCSGKGKRFNNAKDVQRHMMDKGHCKMLHEGEVLYEYADFYDYTSSYPDSETPGIHPDDKVDPMELDGNGFSLTLPSGVTIGHRSLLKYYRQNMVPHNHDHSNKVLPKMLSHYKALGWTGSTGPQVALRAKDLQCLQREKKRHFLRLGTKANGLRHRFKDPNGLVR